MSYDPELLRGAIDELSGDAEVHAKWAAEHRDAFRFIDVREPHELTGPLGKIEGIENIPLLTLFTQAESFSKDEPVVLICRSGRRSGEAVRRLREAGVDVAASVEGGMIAWNTDVFGKPTILRDEKVANTKNLAEAVSRANGLPEVSAKWVAANIGRFRLIDVRQPHELVTHGKVAQAENVPLETFMNAAQKLDREAPFVVMCMSGGRSGRVVHALESAGFKSVASLEGGIIGWKASGLDVAQPS